MKILVGYDGSNAAIPTETDDGNDAHVHAHFGSAPYIRSMIHIAMHLNMSKIQTIITFTECVDPWLHWKAAVSMTLFARVWVRGPCKD